MRDTTWYPVKNARWTCPAWAVRVEVEPFEDRFDAVDWTVDTPLSSVTYFDAAGLGLKASIMPTEVAVRALTY